MSTDQIEATPTRGITITGHGLEHETSVISSLMQAARRGSPGTQFGLQKGHNEVRIANIPDRHYSAVFGEIVRVTAMNRAIKMNLVEDKAPAAADSPSAARKHNVYTSLPQPAAAATNARRLQTSGPFFGAAQPQGGQATIDIAGEFDTDSLETVLKTMRGVLGYYPQYLELKKDENSLFHDGIRLLNLPEKKIDQIVTSLNTALYSNGLQDDFTIYAPNVPREPYPVAADMSAIDEDARLVYQAHITLTVDPR